MASYELQIKPTAIKELERIGSKKDRQRIVERIALLESDPRPSGCVKLTAREGHRVRQGPYRILYEVDDERRLVTVFKIGHRRDFYQ